MATPREALNVVADTLDSGIPSDANVLLHEADMDNQDADIPLPIYEFQLVEASNVVVHNSDLAGYEYDDEGNTIARLYHGEYELEFEINAWTIPDVEYDVAQLRDAMQETLYPYTSYGPDEPFLDEDGDEVTSITYFRMDTGSREDDLFQTPTVRKWSQTFELWGYEEFRTDEDYIVEIDAPSADEITGDNDRLDS